MANYLTYPFKTMRITQNYNGTTSHRPHVTGKPCDYPIDEGGADTGRDWFYCPCDEIKIMKIYGVGNSGVNTMWIQSTSKVNFADGTSDYFCAQLTHMNDSDLRRLKVGQTFKRGQPVCQEGIDGASGNHIHMSVGKGTMSGSGWTQNTNRKWVLITTKGPIKPEQAFFVDEKFTKIASSAGLTFKKLSAATSSKKTGTATTSAKYKLGDYKTTNDLNVRRNASTLYPRLKFDKFTENAQKAVKKLNGGQPADYFPKGMEVTISEIKGDWGKCPSGWLNLKYCKKI